REEIAAEHLLLGILRQDPSLVPARAIEAMRRAIEAKAEGWALRPKRRLRTRAIPLSAETDRAVAAAKEIAQAAGRKVLPRDLATGILREPNSFAAGLLRDHLA